jgi:hypothetical protein
MVKGIYLTLMIGPAVPYPAPKEVIDALTSIQVTSRSEGASGFQLTFTISHRSLLNTLFLLAGGAPIPLVRVIIVVTVNGNSEVLMDGMMTNHEISPGSDSSYSTLTVTGEDMTKVMDYKDFSGINYPATTREGRVALILAKYAGFGIVPKIVPSPLVDIPIPTDKIHSHWGTDLCYIRQLASEVGYVFYIEPGPKPGMSTAYWGPDIKVGEPQPALNTNMDVHTNVESLSFSFNSESRGLPLVVIQDPKTNKSMEIPVPDITPLNPPLGLLPPVIKNFNRIYGTSKYSAVRAALIALATAAKSTDAISASGSLDVLRYGHILKAGRLVGVRGAGIAFDGLYYAKEVTHKIKRGEYKQSFKLSRNALVSTLPKVPA